jgi:putative transposase
VERIIGSIRRDCLDHVVVLNDRYLKRILKSYFNYYHHWRTHLSLGMDSPESRSVQLPALGKVVHNQRSVAYITIMNGWQLDSV